MPESSGSVSRSAKEIFGEIVELARDEREAAVARLAGGDAAVRAEVESLLAAHDEAERFLEDPTIAPGPDASAAGLRVEGVGSWIGPYHLAAVIGEGGFGTVYLAEQEQPVRRRVALKVIKLGMDTRQVIARFEAERQALAIMDHPNIARVLEAGATDAGRPYFVMELVEGVPITRYCDEHRLTPRQRLELFIPVAQAVQHAHTKGIIHRDVKPSNVLVAEQDGKPVPKVIDFGIAKATQARLTERTLFTEARQLVGTPEYMSPEQAGMSGGDIDTRSDIYSLGVLLYELLTGTTPFDSRELRSKAFDEIQRTIREVEPPRPSTRISDLRDALPTIAANRRIDPLRLTTLIRGELDWIVMKCMEKERSRRYQTAAALANDIGHYLADEPVSAAAPSRGYLARKFARRHKIGLAAASAVLAALVIGLLLATWGLLEARRERDLAEAARRDAVDAQRAAESARAAEAEAREFERETSRFIRDMFESIEPSRAQGRQVLVTDILEAAARKIDLEPPSHPLVEAGLRYTFGRAFAQLGQLDAAQSQLERSAAIYRTNRGQTSASTAQTLIVLGLIHYQRGEYDRAVAVRREAAETFRTLFGELDERTIATEVELADSLTRLRDFAAAQAIADSLLPRVRQARGAESQDAIHLIYLLATLHQEKGEMEQAEARYREAMLLAEKTLGVNHPFWIVLAGNLGNVLRAMNRLDEAVDYVTRSNEASVRVYGPDHPDTLASANNLGLLLQAAGEMEEARRVFLDCIERRSRVLGEEHPGTLLTRSNYGLLLMALGELDAAEQTFESLRDPMARVLGQDHVDALVLESNIARLHAARGDLEAAEAIYRQIVPRTRAAHGEGSFPAISFTMRWGDILLQLGRAGDALPMLAAAREAAVGLAPPAAMAGYTALLGIALSDTGDHAQAVTTLPGAIAVMEAQPTPDAALLARSYAALARSHAALGNDAEAETWRGRTPPGQ